MRTPILGGDKRSTSDGTPIGSERVVEVGRTTSAAGDPHVLATVDSARAYEQGRQDALRAEEMARERDRMATDRAAADRAATERVPAERAVVASRRRRFPLLSLIVTILALIGLAWIVLTIMNGSARQGGEAVDRKVSEVTAPARQAVDNVRNTTGQAVENAGSALKNSGERIKKP